MRKEDFDEKIKLINDLKKSITPLKEEIVNKSTFISNKIKEYNNAVQEKDNAYYEYLKLLGEFSYADTLTAPSDVFPGIRVTSANVDVENLKQKTELMKNYASKVDAVSKNIDILTKDIISDLKRCLAVFTELNLREENLTQTELDLLTDMDSAYDIRNLSSAT